MIRLGLVSDSHGRETNMSRAVKKLKEMNVSGLCHMGDTAYDGHRMADALNVAHYVVRGNCDYVMDDAPRELTMRIGGYTLLICHGDRYGVKMSLTQLSLRAREVGADVVLFGHTHEPTVEHDGHILYVNPGGLLEGRFGILEFRERGPVPKLLHV